MQQNSSFNTLLISKITYFKEIFMKKMVFAIFIVLPFIFSCSSPGNDDVELIPVSGPEEPATLTIVRGEDSSSMYPDLKGNLRADGDSSVDSFMIGSADIFAFSYDFTNDRWDTPLVNGIPYENSIEPGTTYDNDPKALFIDNEVEFFPEGNDISDNIDQSNIPSTIDILYLDNRWHNVTIDDVEYGDWSFTGNAIDVDNKLPDGTVFGSFDIVYINRNIFPVNCLFYRSGSDLGTLSIVTSEYAGNQEYLDTACKVFEQVREIESYALFIPIDPVDYVEGETNIEITLRLDNLVYEYQGDGSMYYQIDENGSPLTYDWLQ
jgi:hypothetical protein